MVANKRGSIIQATEERDDTNIHGFAQGYGGGRQGETGSVKKEWVEKALRMSDLLINFPQIKSVVGISKPF